MPDVSSEALKESSLDSEAWALLPHWLESWNNGGAAPVNETKALLAKRDEDMNFTDEDVAAIQGQDKGYQGKTTDGGDMLTEEDPASVLDDETIADMVKQPKSATYGERIRKTEERTDELERLWNNVITFKFSGAQITALKECVEALERETWPEKHSSRIKELTRAHQSMQTVVGANGKAIEELKQWQQQHDEGDFHSDLRNLAKGNPTAEKFAEDLIAAGSKKEIGGVEIEDSEHHWRYIDKESIPHSVTKNSTYGRIITEAFRLQEQVAELKKDNAAMSKALQISDLLEARAERKKIVDSLGGWREEMD